MKEKILTEELKLESVVEENGKFYFMAESLNTNFEPVEGLKILANVNMNKDLVWRHRHPLEDVSNEIYGRIDKSFVKNEKLITKYECYDYDEKRRNFIELVKKRLKVGDPLGISMRYRKYFKDESDEIIHYDVFEHSGTPFPACEQCKTIEVVNEMDEKELEESKARILELEEKLNSKIECFEKLKEKVESLEKELENKKEELESKDTTLEEREKKNLTLEEKLERLNEEVDFLKKKPIIDQMLEIEDLDDVHVEFYKRLDKKYLESMLEKMIKKAKAKPQVKSQKQSADEVMEKNGEDEELEKKKPTFEEFTRSLNLKKRGKK